MRSSSIFLRAVCLSAALATASAPSLAGAQPSKAPLSKSEKLETARMKKEADALMTQDRYVDALALYAKVYETTGDTALLYNQGRALEAMGDYADALDKLERFEKEASPSLRAKVPGLRDLIADVRGRIATLVVTTNAAGARLLVRDKAAGTIEKESRVRTRAGVASIEVSAEGYVSFKKDIDLVAGTVVKVDAQLQLKKADALIIVRSKPVADIAVDGKSIGRVPLEMHLPAGKHTLVADAAGYESEKVPMTLALGDHRELDIELHKSTPITSKWWFWTAIGVAAATVGGIATYVIVTTERDPTPGSFGPGLTTGP